MVDGRGQAERDRRSRPPISAKTYFADVEALHKQETASELAALAQQLAQLKAYYADAMAIQGLTFDQAIALNNKYVAGKRRLNGRDRRS